MLSNCRTDFRRTFNVMQRHLADRLHGGFQEQFAPHQTDLKLPRRQNPRLLTPAGTISIGGVQTGVQCLAGPSGWHLLGRTAVRTYQLHRDPIFLLEPGDNVSFTPVDARTFAEQDRAAEAGELIAEQITA